MDLRAVGGGRMRLRVADDGVGMPAAKRRAGGSLGLRLIEVLARQVRGEAPLAAGPGGEGAVVAVTFPDPSDLSG